MRAAFVLLLTFCFSVPASALDIDNDVVWFDFSGWDNSQVKGAGQTLENIFKNVDLTAVVTGDFTLPTSVIGSGLGLISQNAIIGSQTFDFTLSEPLPLVVRYTTTDDYERFDLLNDEILTHTHTLGGVPMITSIPGGQSVMGVAHFVNDSGASRGFFELGATSGLSVTHHALTPLKFEAFQIGAVVPEPSSAPLFILGLFVMTLRARRSVGTGIHRIS